MAFDFLNLRKSIEDIGKQYNKITDELESLRQTREEMAAAPAPREELAESLCYCIDEMGKEYPERIMKFKLRGLRDRCTNPKEASHIPNLLSAMGSNSDVTAEALFFLLSDTLKDGVKRAVEAMPYEMPEGLPREKRAIELAKLDQRIAALEKESTSLAQQANAAGISLKRVGR